MSKCDYCCDRPSSLIINCLKCSSTSINLCFKCSINVNQLRQHCKNHPLSTYKLIDTPLDENNLSEWLCNDEINLIELIESCGLGNWNDIGLKSSKTPSDCQSHFENLYLSRSTSPFSIYFQSFNFSKPLIGEDSINDFNLKTNSIIYPPMFIDHEKQKCLTYMPFRDEYEREFMNCAENRLPLLINDELFSQINIKQEQDHSTTLLNKSKCSILNSYSQILKRRFELKRFIRDYAIGLNYSPDQPMDLHQISRFLTADEYQRLVYNHRRIRSLLEEIGCSTSSNGTNHQSQPKKKLRRQTTSQMADESSSLSSSESTLSLSSTSQCQQSNGKRRSVRRVSSSSSSETNSTSLKEPLYKRRRTSPADSLEKKNLPQRNKSSSNNVLTTSDVSCESSDDEFNQFDQSAVASRTRSHTPPNVSSNRRQSKNSLWSKRSTNGLNKFDPSDESTPKTNRMLTRQQFVVQQNSPSKKKHFRSNSNSNDEHFI